MRTVSRLIALAVLPVLCACASAGGPRPTGNGEPDMGVEGRPIKVTMLKFSQDARTGKWKGDYYVMLSRGWKLRYGPWAREPFEKVFRSPFKGVEIQDVRMVEIVAALRSKRWDEFPATSLDRVDVNWLSKVDRNPGLAPTVRYITVQDGPEPKSVYMEDVRATGNDALYSAYAACELIVLKAAMQHTVQISIETKPIVPK